MSKKYQSILFHLIAYYAVWFCSVFSASKNSNALLLFSLIVIAIQFFWQKYYMKDSKGLIQFILCLITFTVLIETIIIHFDLIQYKGDFILSFLPPVWIIILWIEFAIILFSLLKSYFTTFT
jgi:signal transduction histidine kinase